jgi:hypothetical protein
MAHSQHRGRQRKVFLHKGRFTPQTGSLRLVHRRSPASGLENRGATRLDTPVFVARHYLIGIATNEPSAVIPSNRYCERPQFGLGEACSDP